jgi:hypothetical protein
MSRFARFFSFLALLFILAGCRAAPTPTATVPLPSPTFTLQPTFTPAPPANLTLTFQDVRGASIDSTVDGNALRLVAHLARPATARDEVQFILGEAAAPPLATCAIAAGADSCFALVRSDGWAWENHERAAERVVRAIPAGNPSLAGATRLRVAPKPVILVHGLNSDATAWSSWTKPGGFLDQSGLHGYAADDEQFGTAVMNMGSATRPLDPTNTIAQNADILARYIAAVRANTGAERVDIVAHSMGGLVSRFYIQNLMPLAEVEGLDPVPTVNQLFMLGTPNLGTACTRIPAALGLVYPASAQVTPEYITQIFNPTVHDQRGVPFFAIAGDAVRDFLAIRCTGQPTDLYVSVDSVLRGVQVSPLEVPLVHSDLNKKQEIFDTVFPSLSRAPSDYPIAMPDETEPITAGDQLVQNTIVQGGTLQAGEMTSVTITIDQARNASFILYAPGSAVSMTIRTVAGAILTQDTPKTNPNVTFEAVDDVTLPLSLGYGVVNPRAGAWVIFLLPRETPPGGGPFAILATLDTDLLMNTEVQPGVVNAGETVALRATFSGPARPRTARVRALVRNARGDMIAEIPMLDDGQHQDGDAGDETFGGVWHTEEAGEYTAVIEATGTNDAGNSFERLSVMGVEVH